MKSLVPLAYNSLKEILRLPFYYIIVFASCFIILISFSFTFFAFGEELKMIRNMGVSTITISGMLAGCLSSSTLITGELEKKATIAILCKPITRAHYLLGKYFGILAAIAIMVLCQLVVLEIALVFRKYMDIPNYIPNPVALIDSFCMIGVCFALFQIVILTSISLVLSLYLNTIANITSCLLFFIFCNTYGYVLPLNDPAVNCISIIVSMLYVFFPDFQNLNLSVLTENTVNESSFWQERLAIQYVVLVAAHCTIYCVSMVWLSIFLFNRKEII